jgi:hypothetical protein
MLAQDLAIYDQAAQSLADLREPDLSSFPSNQVDIAIARAFTVDGPRPEWWARLRQRVTELSNGSVRLEVADRDKFPAMIKDPSTAYARLVGPSKSQLLIIGQFQPPFQFIQSPQHH